MLTTEKADEVVKELRSSEANYTEEELRNLLRAFDEGTIIVLRAIAVITEDHA
jgi:hypothetical protein